MANNSYFINCIPHPQMRSKIAIRGGRPVAFTDQKQASRADLMRYAIREAGIPVLPESLDLDVQFLMPTPKSTRVRAGHEHIKKPDIDNLLKMLFDCLQDLQLMKNDSNVWRVSASKCYAESAGIILTVIDDPASFQAEKMENLIDRSNQSDCQRLADIANNLVVYSHDRLHKLKAQGPEKEKLKKWTA